MHAFISDIQLGFLTFPLVALVITLPYMAYQYRRFGSISVWKTLVVYSFAFYCLCMCYLIALPLPADRTALSLTENPSLILSTSSIKFKPLWQTPLLVWAIGQRGLLP